MSKRVRPSVQLTTTVQLTPLDCKLFFIRGWGYSILIMVWSPSRSKLEIYRRQSTPYFWYPFSRLPLLNIQDCCSHTQTYIRFFFFFNLVVYSTKSIPRSDKRKPNSPAPQSKKRISRYVSETPPQAPSRKPSSPVPQSRKGKSRRISETPSPQAPSRKPSSPVPQSRKEKSRHISETPSPQAQSQASSGISGSCRDDTPYAQSRSNNAFSEDDNDGSSDSTTDFATTQTFKHIDKACLLFFHSQKG